MPLFPDAVILDVDLSRKSIEKRVLSGEIYRLYPGGSALGCYLILQEGMDAKIDPFAPEALMAFSVSPTVGLPFAGNSRMTVTCKSPLTECMGDTQMGGFFPAHLKANNIDSILVRGKAETPVYLYIDNERVELRDASGIWGKDTLDAEKLIKEDIGDSKLQIAAIGPAGENGVLYANIISNPGHANGRNGTGAVMGSKNLKAIVVHEQKARVPYDKDAFAKEFAGQFKTMLDNNVATKNMGIHGTNNGLQGTSAGGFLMTRNAQTGIFPEGEAVITGQALNAKFNNKRGTCFGCAIACKREYKDEQLGIDPKYGGPEYESAAMLGAFCGVADPDAVVMANQRCNALGMDTISAGATIAFAMECYEKGLIDKEETEGRELNFGRGDYLLELLEKIGHGDDGFAKRLAQGSARYSKRVGQGSEKFVMASKKQEFPAHMARFKQGLGLHYSVNVHGADHASCTQVGLVAGPADSQGRQRMASLGMWEGMPNDFGMSDEKTRLVYLGQQWNSIADSLGLCILAWGPGWHFYGPRELILVLRYGLGYETTMADLMLCGERRLNMMRYFNYMAGVRPKTDDVLPERCYEPLPEGAQQGLKIDKEAMDDARELYYAFIGSDPETGRPSDVTFRRLSLQWLLEKYNRA